jgi:hypothetical protein
MAISFDELRQHGLRAAIDHAADAAGASDRVRSLIGQHVAAGVLRNVGQAALAILAAALTHVVSLTRSNPGTMTQAAIHRTSNPSTPVRRSFS